MRLQVFLSHNGVCSRREAMSIIQSGRVKVNGRVIFEPSTPVDGSEQIAVDDRVVGAKAYAYLVLHKPAGYTTTKDDPHAEHTVMELLPPELQHLSPVGRLDRDTEGLLLFTNDGAWAQHITHPKFHLNKTYEARIKGKLEEAKRRQIESGIMLEGRKTSPCRIKDVRYNGEITKAQETHLTITIHEGRKRQIRAMFYTVGHKVVYLKRIAIGPLALGSMKAGQWRVLTPAEIIALSAKST